MNLSQAAAYQGRNSTGTNITSGGVCEASPDGKSEVSFGQLPSGLLAYTCDWGLPQGITTESDTKFDSGTAWSTDEGSGCVNSWIVDDVGSHERGHTLGLRRCN